MASPMLATLRRTLCGLLKGVLDDGVTLAVLRGALFVAAVVAIALVTIDPSVRGEGSVRAMQHAADPALREKILAFWAAHGLADRAGTFLLVDAFLLLPAWALFLVAFLRHFDHLLRADGTPPVFLGFRLPWLLLVFAPILAVLVGVLADLASLYALRLAGPPPLPVWLHWLICIAARACLWLLVATVLAGLWLFFTWYYKTLDTPPEARGEAAAADLERARLRAAVADMLWRSKYAVLVLAFYGVLVLAFDQTRDALVRQVVDGGRDLGTLAGVVITLVAVVLLARASWLWPRLILRLQAPDAAAPQSVRAQAFARWWSRLLGVTPYAVVAVAIGFAIKDVPPDSTAIGWFALCQAVIVAAAFVFLFRVAKRRGGSGGRTPYYACAADMPAARADMGWLPFLVALGAPLVFLLARFTALVGWTQPLALAVITAGLATWAGVLGWVAYESRRSAVPYFLGLVVIVAVLGIFDLTDTHRVRVWASALPALDAGALHFLFGAIVVLALFAFVLAWFWRVTPSLTARVVSGLLAALAVAVAVRLYDPAPGATAPVDRRPALEEAMGAWLRQLHSQLAARPAANAEPYPVFLVASEGGGIRSAYWTAALLTRLKSSVDRFDERTFSISGVSGGALGVATYRACGGEREPKACIDRVGYADLWTQLLGGVLFEDVIATVVPTWWCRGPGCGVLGRSYWFEGALESAVPALAQGLAAAPEPRRRVPHVFLTVTRVETGERAIQSDVAIEWKSFPGATDVTALAGADMRLSTAAHNSARFPLTNPVGAVYGPDCPIDPQRPDGVRTPGGKGLCTRLQDGGYFDNSSALTTADIVRALRRCLFDAPHCGLDAGQVQSLRAALRPVVIAIRNEQRFALAPGGKIEPPCAAPSEARRDPAFPVQAAPLTLLPTLLSAPATLYNTREAHMRLADALLEREAGELWSALGLAARAAAQPACGKAPEWIGARPMIRFDLFADDTLYPSGWMLSQQAMKGIYDQAVRNVP